MKNISKTTQRKSKGGRSATSPYVILPTSDRPPEGRWQGMEVLVRGQAVMGDVIQVKLVDRRSRRALSGASVALKALSGEEAVCATTNANGQAFLVAPPVEFPTVFEIDARLKGYSPYIPASDMRAKHMLMTRGFQPFISTTVSPLILASITPAPETVDFEIDQAFGWFNGTREFAALIEKAVKKGWQADDDWWATKSGMLEHFSQKGPEDMWTFFGHTGLNESTGRVEALMAWQTFFIFRGGRPVTVQELCDEAKQGNGPPGMVVLGGCQSADLLNALVECCVKVAVGFTKPLAYSLIAGALVIFWEALLDGKTLARAIREANEYLDNRPYLNPDECKMVFKAKPHIQNPGGKTLEQIREASRTP